MSKKILISTLLGASLSFATWGYFPLKESDSGLEVKVNHLMAFGDEEPQSINVDARYVLGTSLEIAVLNFGYQISDPDGLQNPLLSARFQLGEKSLVFGEVTLPIGDDGMQEYFHLGYQHALVLKQHFAWSTEIGYKNIFSNDGFDPASTLNLSTEIDVNSSPKFIVFLGGNLDINVSSSEFDDGDDDDYYYSSWYYNDYDYYGDDDDDNDDFFDFGLTVFGGFSLKIGKSTYLQEEVSILLMGVNSYDHSKTAFKTSIKRSF